MRKLLKYLKRYKVQSILAPLFKLLEASFELFVPLVMASLIDVGIKNNDTSYILKMGALLIGLGIIGLTCSITAQYFAAKAATGFGEGLREALFGHINTLSYKELDTLGTSTLVTRLTSDTNQVQTGVNMFLRLFLRSPFIVFGAMIMAFTVDVKAALIFVVTIPLLSIVVFGIIFITLPYYKKLQDKLDKVLLLTRENLSGARVVRAFSKEADEIEAFEEESDRLKTMQLFVGRISGLLNPITFIIVNVATVVILWVGGERVNTGVLTQGETIALVNYMSQILVELVKLANLIITISKALACAKRITDIFETKSDMEFGTSKGSDAMADVQVEFKDVSLKYAGASGDSLSDISFKALKGQVIGVIGGTGSGKSSLVNLIPRFYDATDGEVLVDGVEVKDYDKHALLDKIGVVPQKAVLFAGTIRDNMKWGNACASDDDIWKAIDIAQASDFVKDKTLDYAITQGGKNLSGGQKQRLTIARALVKKPNILILDDSASALDFLTDYKLRMAIRDELKDTTVFIVSQRAASIKYADNILVLDDGCVIAQGKHENLYKTCDLYKEICLSQMSSEEATKNE